MKTIEIKPNGTEITLSEGIISPENKVTIQAMEKLEGKTIEYQYFDKTKWRYVDIYGYSWHESATVSKKKFFKKGGKK